MLVSHWHRVSIFSRFRGIQLTKPMRTRRRTLQVTLYYPCNPLHWTDEKLWLQVNALPKLMNSVTGYTKVMLWSLCM